MPFNSVLKPTAFRTITYILNGLQVDYRSSLVVQKKPLTAFLDYTFCAFLKNLARELQIPLGSRVMYRIVRLMIATEFIYKTLYEIAFLLQLI